MKRAFTAVFLFYSIATCNLLSGQKISVPQIPIDSISYFEHLGDFDNRYRIIKNYEDSLKRLKLYTHFKSTDSLYNYLPKTKIDSSRYRYYTLFHGQKIKNYLGQYDHALYYYTLAHQHAIDKNNLDKYCVNIELLIGNIYARRNDFDKAIYYHTLVIPYLKKEKKYGRLSRSCSDIGNVYKWLGQFDKMEDYYLEGVKLAHESKEYRGLQANYAGLADYLINYVSPENYDHKAIVDNLNKSNKAIFDNPKSDKYKNLRLMNVQELWSQYYLKIDSTDAALKSTLASNQIAKKEYKSLVSREIAKSNYEVAKVYFKIGDLTKSEAYIDSAFTNLLPNRTPRVLPRVAQLYDENTFTDLFSLQSKVYKKKYLLTKNRNYLDSILIAINHAFDANDGLESYLTMQGSKLISAQQNKQLVGQAIEVYCIYNELSIPYQKTQLREIFNRSKSRILNENQYRASALNSLDAKTKENLLRYETALLELKRHEETQSLILKEHQLREKIDSIKTANLGELQRTNSLTDPYLEYVDVDSIYYIYTNIGSESLLQIKNKFEVDSIADLVKSAIHQRKTKGLDSNLKKLYSELIPIDLDGLKEVTFICDGQLSYVPFDLLINNERYLIQDVTIKYSQSAFNHTEGSSNKNQNKILCLAPQYETLQSSNINTTRGELSALPYTQDEIEKIKEVFPSALEQHKYMALDELNNEIKEANIFHFAGHAIARNDSAYLVQMDTGRMELILDNQILEMTNQLDLVTLSACETGLGTYHSGEGIESLATSFLNNGAKSIVYSLWNVNDQSTSEIMQVFYQELAKGRRKGEALRTAKLDYLDQAAPDARHPYYWAAFCMVGNDSVIASSNNSTIVLLVLLFLAIGILYFFKTNRTST